LTLDDQTQRAWEQTPYGQVHRDAAASSATQAERMRTATQQHFLRHRACQYPITKTYADGTVVRDYRRRVTWHMRASPQWWQAGHLWADDLPQVSRGLEDMVFTWLQHRMWRFSTSAELTVLDAHALKRQSYHRRTQQAASLRSLA
jgi:hypothetical protein